MYFLELTKSIPSELAVFILSAIPVVEVRGAVPLGLYLGISPVKVFILSVLGSALPILPVLFFLTFFTERLRKINIFDRFFGWLFERTRRKGKIIEDLELLGLTIFVAIPLPGTGVWTGCLAGHLFGLSYLKTFIACFVGTSIATFIMLLVSLGVIRFF
ncbi:hypothetical protein A2230_07300 [candidate division WOR-1 bacterium RIFOXYA2_FULL_36_21]|uniref:Ligand-binding protein SH3 n=1 Tax=candidate division WOR-1 bacterium RIFOXYB2_FULL_36_35 TaxID=1802578 RepID=A0A1F4S8R1_UNCSA|nr:MAG: hypothetical protein A2230_07300 [candidate division WOR-1 bacterium RIFOXYA2_FULL_36_21]OGC16791.1 MAG: hypothetical protein A2290_07900 [candidate division WOR-1 bacterium RIFOXYB2_FULL_36_35]OGC19806.1 MAG: hypothetical protein A2282_01050 [candidate division WOR-1 bacterium RIFOXYA12_FULL_36_13]